MKYLLILLIIITPMAFAEEVEIFSYDHFDGNYYSKPYYRVNSAQGTARFSITIDGCAINNRPFGCSADWRYFRTERIDVRAMRFNQSTEDIEIDNGGAVTICANTYLKRSRLGRMKRIIKPTGACTFTPRIEYVEQRRGNRTLRVRKYRLFLNY